MRKILMVICVMGSFALFGQNVIASAELEAKNINEVKVEGAFCDVYVERGSRNYLEAEISGRGDVGDYEFQTDIVGSTLVVKVIRNESRSWKSWNMDESKIELTIKENVRLDIDNSSGDIRVSDLSANDSKIEATSGDIILRRITADLEVETSSGDISINEMTGELEIESTSGDQRMSGVKGNIESRASSGDITVSDFDGELDIETTSGDVNLRGGIGMMRIRTTSGGIEGDDVELTGGAYFKASSGDIDFNFVNDLEDLSFDLTATSGNLDAGNRSADRKLYIDRGGYKVTGVTSSGDQDYR